MINRILKALGVKQAAEKLDSMWLWCYSYSDKIEINESSLENIANTNLVHGFFGITNPHINSGAIINLCFALGVFKVVNPEGGDTPAAREVDLLKYSDSELLTLIQSRLDFDITFPPFIGGRNLTKTIYGIVTNRHCHYLWVVKRIIELCPDKNSRIIEIGAGLGLLGWYLDRIGYKDFTIIDIARTNACQSYFLYKNLPHRNFILSGEEENPFEDKESIKILHISDFIYVPKDRFDLMVNIDGFTEMGKDTAFNYINSNCASTVLSINHEANKYSVCELNTSKKLIYRYPFWLRNGYVEELYKNNPLT